MNTFYIVRHGETENNRAQRFAGWIDTPLTEKGLAQAHVLATKLQSVPIGIIISSDLGRAFVTAYIISRDIGYTQEIERLKGLREMNYGTFANQPYGVYPVMTPAENAAFRPEDGESLQDVQVRTLACLKELDAQHTDAHILIVGHDGTINSIRANCTNETMGEADLVHNPHDAVFQFTVADGRIDSFAAI